MSEGFSAKVQNMFSSISDRMSFGFGRKNNGGDPEQGGGNQEDATFSNRNLAEPDWSSMSPQERASAARKIDNITVGRTPGEGTGKVNQDYGSSTSEKRTTFLRGRNS